MLAAVKRPITRLLALGALGASLGGCVLGKEKAPGCRVDHDCDPGFVCRAGACFRYNTEAGTPIDPSKDGGADGAAQDAAGDAKAD